MPETRFVAGSVKRPSPRSARLPVDLAACQTTNLVPSPSSFPLCFQLYNSQSSRPSLRILHNVRSSLERLTSGRTRSARSGALKSARLLECRFSLGRLRVLSVFEDEVVAGHVDQDGVSLLEIAGQHLHRQRVLDVALDDALQRSCTVHRIVSQLSQLVLGRVRQLDVQPRSRRI